MHLFLDWLLVILLIGVLVAVLRLRTPEVLRVEVPVPDPPVPAPKSVPIQAPARPHQVVQWADLVSGSMRPLGEIRIDAARRAPTLLARVKGQQCSFVLAGFQKDTGRPVYRRVGVERESP